MRRKIVSLIVGGGALGSILVGVPGVTAGAQEPKAAQHDTQDDERHHHHHLHHSHHEEHKEAHGG